MEQDASTLRISSPWRSWLRTVRDYASSDGVKGTREAAILADAIEEHGCGFLANLSARNISLGGCFSWADHLGWDFKTVEVWCPITCGCESSTTLNSGCPRVFSMACDQVQMSCLTVNNTHYCPGINAATVYFEFAYGYWKDTNAEPLVKMSSQLCPALRLTPLPMAFETAFANATGVDSSVVLHRDMHTVFTTPTYGEIYASIRIFLFDGDGQNKTIVKDLVAELSHWMNQETLQARQLLFSSRCVRESTV